MGVLVEEYQEGFDAAVDGDALANLQDIPAVAALENEFKVYRVTYSELATEIAEGIESYRPE